MIVLYSQPNILKLPYKVINQVQLRDEKQRLVYDKDGNPKIVNKESAKYFSFVPGKNIIPKEIWINIVEYNKDDMDYYLTILSIFRPKTIEIDNEKDEKEEIEIGEDEDKIDISELSTREFRDLIENTMDLNELNGYLKFENERNKSRPGVLKSIKSMKDKISKADQAVEKSQKGKK